MINGAGRIGWETTAMSVLSSWKKELIRLPDGGDPFNAGKEPAFGRTGKKRE